MERVGFIGLGIMGSRMAANLARAGCELTVHNRTRARAEASNCDDSRMPGPVVRQRCRPGREWNHHVGGLNQLKTGGQDADDCVRLTI